MDEKPKLLRNFEKILKFFDENSIEKLNFLFFFIFIFYFFENLLLKIELSEISPFFYNNFFGFGGGSPFPPGYALAFNRKIPQIFIHHKWNLLELFFIIYSIILQKNMFSFFTNLKYRWIKCSWWKSYSNVFQNEGNLFNFAFFYLACNASYYIQPTVLPFYSFWRVFCYKPEY